MLLGAHQPQMIGASAFHEAQIVGVIDDAGKIWDGVIATTKCSYFNGSPALRRLTRPVERVSSGTEEPKQNGKTPAVYMASHRAAA
jgi:hypothetical protein